MVGFDTILIANRGEIAVRVARTARRLGYRTVAVYSDADADAVHVAVADEAVHIGASPAGQSYLKIDAVLDAAARSGAQAIHPGYGFLSENPDFAEAVADAGLALIGPPVEAIRLMGNKRLAKLEMEKAGIPCIPGYQGADQSDERLLAEAEAIGCPLMVKAAAGGGGKGMRLVADPADIPSAIKAARAEGLNAFGSEELILERALISPRHIEVQVFADSHGNAIHLGERDCSVQRRHQKVIEEAPSPFVDEELRVAMGAAAVAVARGCGYIGAGTVEFLVDAERNFYFLEMNTRLQVEHPVTEEVTGIDLVEMQFRVAAGEVLSVAQEDVCLSGHAIEARFYAEDPSCGFLPQTGPVLLWEPPVGEAVRVDHGIRSGGQVSEYYDPMLAKVIGYGRTRADAIRVLDRALANLQLFGARHNAAFLRGIVSHEAFRAGEATTGFIDEHMQDDPSLRPGHAPTEAVALASVLMLDGGRGPRLRLHHGLDYWQRLTLGCEEERFEILAARRSKTEFDVKVGEEQFAVALHRVADHHVGYAVNGIRSRAAFLKAGTELHLGLDGASLVFTDQRYAPPETAAQAGRGALLAPMEGTVVDVHCAAGDTVGRGQVLVVVEAMKMQHQMASDIDGIVSEVTVEVGRQVKRRELLVSVEPAE
jgi:geranyl-CoA carboxylase alpha subunit